MRSLLIPAADRPVLGIFLMLGFCVLAPLADAIVKILGDAVPLAMVIFLRFLIQAVLLIPLTLGRGASLALPRAVWPIMVVRTALHLCGIALMFLALRFMPLADAIAIAYVMPFFVLLAGWFWLGERVGPRRLITCCVGFAGTLLILKPSFAALGPVALLPVAVAVVFSVFMLLTRVVSRAIPPLELQAVNGFLGAALMAPFLGLGLAIDAPELALVWPDGRQMVLLLLIGGLGTVAHLFLTWSLSVAPASTLAPIQYLEIPVAVLLGLVIFREFPDGLAILGIAVVMACGLYLIWRENAGASAGPAEAP
ncbi:MAG: DMT family transporter [Pseudomonadota bacterium]